MYLYDCTVSRILMIMFDKKMASAFIASINIDILSFDNQLSSKIFSMISCNMIKWIYQFEICIPIPFLNFHQNVSINPILKK